MGRISAEEKLIAVKRRLEGGESFEAYEMIAYVRPKDSTLSGRAKISLEVRNYDPKQISGLDAVYRDGKMCVSWDPVENVSEYYVVYKLYKNGYIEATGYCFNVYKPSYEIDMSVFDLNMADKAQKYRLDVSVNCEYKTYIDLGNDSETIYHYFMASKSFDALNEETTDSHQHIWNTNYTIDKNSNCIEEGIESIHCSVCDAKKDGSEKVIPSTGHDTKTELVKATLTKDGTITDHCQICGKDVAKRIIPRASSMNLSDMTYTYNGTVKTPAVTVKDAKGKVLSKNNDYTVSYATGRKYVGTYKVTVTFKGNYSGSKILSFKIIPKGTYISSLTKSTKAFTVKWKKQSTQTSGYQILYSTSSKFKSSNKYVTVTSNKTNSKKITKLQAKKKYYVKVRTYKTVNDTRYYSNWSSVKTVTTK